MRLHSDKLTTRDIYDALFRAQDSKQVHQDVYFWVLEERGSRTRKQAWEVQLGIDEKVPGDGRRHKNTGSYGAASESNSGENIYAAFYDEWGWFIAELYRLDPDLVFGHYTTREVFDSVTKFKFIIDTNLSLVPKN